VNKDKRILLQFLLKSGFSNIKFVEETSCSKIYLLIKDNKKIILKWCKKSKQAVFEFNNLNLVYNLWLQNRKKLGFYIPKPYELNKKYNYFTMEYISNSSSLFDLIFNENPPKIKTYFEKAGRSLAQYHGLTPKLADKINIMKLHNHKNIESIFRSKNGEKYLKLL